MLIMIGESMMSDSEDMEIMEKEESGPTRKLQSPPAKMKSISSFFKAKPKTTKLLSPSAQKEAASADSSKANLGKEVVVPISFNDSATEFEEAEKKIAPTNMTKTKQIETKTESIEGDVTAFVSEKGRKKKEQKVKTDSKTSFMDTSETESIVIVDGKVTAFMSEKGKKKNAQKVKIDSKTSVKDTSASAPVCAPTEMSYEDFLGKGNLVDTKPETEEMVNQDLEETTISALDKPENVVAEDLENSTMSENDTIKPDVNLEKEKKDVSEVIVVKKTKRSKKQMVLKEGGKPVKTEVLLDTVDHENEEPPLVKPKGVAAITSFFGKTTKPLVCTVKKESEKITFKADIHKEPSPPYESPCASPETGKNKKTRSKSNAVVDEVDFDMSIELIESTEVLVSELKGNKKHVKRVRDNRERVTIRKSPRKLLQKSAFDVMLNSNQEIKKKLSGEMAKSKKIEAKKESVVVLEENDGTDCVLEARKTKKEQKEEESKAMETAAGIRREEVAAQMALMDNVKVEKASKRTQAVLNFGQKGIPLAKAAEPDQPKKTVLDDTDSDSNFSPKSKRGNKNSGKATAKKTNKAKLNLNSKLSKVNKIRGRNPKFSHLRSASTSEDDEPEESLVCSPAGRRGMKRLHSDDSCDSVYKSQPVPSRRKGRRASLVLKFTRVSSDDTEAFSPKSKAKAKSKELKKNEAQRLLQRAKSVKQKTNVRPTLTTRKRSSKNGSDSTPQGESLRRSSRTSSLTATQAISIGYCDDRIVRTPKKKKDSENDVPGPKCKKTLGSAQKKLAARSPRKTPSKKKNSKKVAVKLAPIFCNSKKNEKKEESISISSDEETEEQKAAKQVRRQFLLSGVPETLRRQQALQEMVSASEHTPVPLVSHVQQIPTAESWLHEEQTDLRWKGLFEKLRRMVKQKDEKKMHVKKVDDESSEELDDVDVVSGGGFESDTAMDTETAADVDKNAEGHGDEQTVDEEKESEEKNAAQCELKYDAIKKDKPVIDLSINSIVVPEITWADPWRLGSAPVPKCNELAELTVEASHDWNKMKLNQATVQPPISIVKESEKAPSPEISESVIPYLLAEVATDNPGFPVHRVYRNLSQRNKDVLEKPSDQIGAALALEVCNPSKKRKPDEPPVPSKPARKKRRGSSSDVILIDSPVPSPESQTSSEIGNASGCDQTWADKYAPRQAGGVMGQTTAVRKLKAWLLDWRRRTDSEMKRRFREEMRLARRTGSTKEDVKKKLGMEWMAADDSDFDLSQEDSDSDEPVEEDSGLCNTTLLTGPHGCGKTALVYALAQELGYKVFEVNASTRRSGRQILAQLQEATQSHQVSKRNLELAPASPAAPPPQIRTESKKPEKPKKKLAGAFASLFNKKAEPMPPAKTEEKTKKGRPKKKVESDEKEADEFATARQTRPRRGTQATDDKPVKNTRETVPDSTSQGAALEACKKGLELSSVSLILFDEVDLVLEEDKGFWPAIQTFMATTKRPILLTASDPGFLNKFRAPVEHLSLRSPNMRTLTAYLQLVCLVEGLRTPAVSLLPLVATLGGDLRSLLLTLQLWGGGTSSGSEGQTRPITYSKRHLRLPTEATGSGGVAVLPASPIRARVAPTCDGDSEDEFVPANKPRPRRTRRLQIIDEDSLSSPVKPKLLTSSGGLTEDDDSQQFPLAMCSQPGPDADTMTMPVDEPTPADHVLCVNQVMGLTGARAGQSLTQNLLDSAGYHSDSWGEAQQRFLELGVDLLHPNLNLVLPLPTVSAPLCPRIAPLPPPSNKRTRILNSCDIYDSEGSSDGFLTLNKTEPVANEKPVESPGVAPVLTNEPLPSKLVPEGEKIVTDSLTELAAMYNSLSFADSYLTSSTMNRQGPISKNEFDFAPGSLSAGQTEDSRKVESASGGGCNTAVELCAAYQSGCVGRTCRELSAIMERHSHLTTDSKSVLNQLSLPMEDTRPYFRISQEVSTQRCYQRAAERVAGVLPTHLHAHKRALAEDYMPGVRFMCRAEQLRAVAGTKRRFFHYLDGMVNQMKQSTIDTLCSSFT